MMLKTYKLMSLAIADKISRDTVKRRTDKYLPIRFDSYESKRKSSRWYSIRYARVNEILDSILEWKWKTEDLN